MTKMFDPFKIYDEAWEVPEVIEQVPVTTPSVVRPNFRTPPIATLYWAEDGGPVRTILDGAKTRPTGFTPMIKGGFRTMPWDSFWEERAMQLADISSRVHYLLAQPHRLEIGVRGNRGRKLIYFPDILMKVDPSFVEDLKAGVRFIDAIRTPTSVRLPQSDWEILIIEIKADVDSRDNKVSYRQKLELADEVYARRGWHFMELRESAHFKSKFLKTARLWDSRKQVALDELDLEMCRRAFNGGATTTLGRLEHALGGGQIGRAKALGLHYRQVISIDLSRIDGGAIVYLMNGEVAR